ncbi:uncharacterized protein LOC135148483 [Daucus carota subsp. sativus]|uniref:uncharacterized protein LOC135148483 n=1 Tax=Daucus carota subsp. sativus TaxID=79200 RepID=UPI003083A9FB
METKSKGRQNIVMEKMSKESSLRVTFSKRRCGLFKNARPESNEFNHPSTCTGSSQEQKKKGEELIKLKKKRQEMFSWEALIDDLRFEQLDMLKTGMEDLKRSIATQAQNLVMMEHALALDGCSTSTGLIMTPNGFNLGHGCGHPIVYQN